MIGRIRTMQFVEEPGLLDLCLILSLTLHLLAVNVATAAPLVCIWLKRREMRQSDAVAGRVGRFLAWQSLGALAVGMILGAATLGLVWLSDDHGFFAALAAVPRRRLWFGAAELLFFFACMGFYAATWQRLAHRPWLQHGVALLAATDLIYHFPPLFAALAVMQSRPELGGQELGYRQFMALLGEWETLARVAHFLLASCAVTGTLMILYAWRWLRDDADAAQRVAVWGARLALAPTLLQLLVGTGLLLSLPDVSRAKLMGGDPLASALFLASAVAIFPLMHHLAAVATGDAERGQMLRSLVWMGLVVVLMVGTRHFAQHRPLQLREALTGAFDESGNR